MIEEITLEVLESRRFPGLTVDRHPNGQPLGFIYDGQYYRLVSFDEARQVWFVKPMDTDHFG